MPEAADLRIDDGVSPAARTLACTPAGVFLWPGSALLAKLGGQFVVRPRDRVYDLVCRLHGPRAAWTPLLPTLERAARHLNEGDVAGARARVDRLALPPLSRAGADLMTAIARRFDLAPLALPVAPDDYAGLAPDLAAGLAEAYYAVAPDIWPLRKMAAAREFDDGGFDDKHPRLGGPPNAGRFVAAARKPAQPPNFRRFFDTLHAPLSGAAKRLGLPEDYLLGLSAYESGYLDDHNFALNNPLGLTRAGGRNLPFASVDAAIAYWVDRYGDQVRGASSPRDFALRLKGIRDGQPMSGWKSYNSRTEGWIDGVVGVIDSVGRHKERWSRDR